jgi:hypothetical protein
VLVATRRKGMTRRTLLAFTIGLVVLAAGGGETTWADRSVVVGPGGSQADPSGVAPVQRARIGEQWHSDCLGMSDDPEWGPCEGDDEIILTVEGNTLHVLHTNATYNCCPDDIVISLEIEENLLRLTEEEILVDPCYCICCYDVTASVVDLAPGTYTVEFYWFDYQTHGERCHVEEIVIEGGPHPDGNVPPVAGDPGDSPADPVDTKPLQPRVEEYFDSGCLGEGGGGDWNACEDDDEIILTVEGNTLHVLHANATYNCCPDEIVISLEVEQNRLLLTEEEILTDPCYCVCCYEVGARVVDLAPGTYIVEFCWFDYETHGERWHVEEIVIEGGPYPDGNTPPVGGDPGDSPADPVDTKRLTGPQRPDYWHSDCLEMEYDPDWWPCEGDDEITLTVEGHTLYVQHANATYNCCPDDIVVWAEVGENLILLTEEEVLTNPCDCVCCYEVNAAVVDLASGEYTVEFCWFDYQTWEERCHVENIVIP